jgi:endoglucanase
MKKRFTTILGLLLMLGIQTQAQEVAPDETGMEMTAQEWNKAVVMGWNLGNSMESSGGETGWGNPKTTKEMIQAVKEAGFNAIRIPVRWTEQLSDETTMTVKPEWLARVKEIVDWCLDEDMQVIINTHHEAWLDRHPQKATQEVNNQKLAALWTCIATYFRDYDKRLAFAGTNETISLNADGSENWGEPTQEYQEVQNSYNQTFIDAVRATGGKNYYRHLIVQTYACSAWNGFKGFTIPTDVVEGRMSVEVHNYDPYEYAGGGTYYYWGDEYKAKGYKTPSSNEKSLTDYMDRLNNTWGKKGLGVVIGEYGATNHYTNDDKQTQMENQQYWYKTMVSAMRERGFSAFVWDNNVFGNGTEKFGIFKRSQNMAVGNEYSLKGIYEGSSTEYKEPESHGGGDDKPVEGEVFWEGDAILDWGDGLQLTIPAQNFEAIGKGARMILYYTLDFNDYNMIQLFYGDWKDNPSFIINGQEMAKEFRPSDLHGLQNGDDGVTEITFSDNVFDIILQKGIVFQGHGLRLKKVELASSETGIQSVIRTKDSDAPIYNLSGQRVNSPRKGIYIQNGRKYIVS